MPDKFNITSSERLVHATVQQRKEQYYLVTAETLASIRSSSYLIDLFTFLGSLLLGAWLSSNIALASLTLDQLRQLPDLTAYRIMFGIFGLLFVVLAIIFFLIRHCKIKSVERFYTAVGEAEQKK